MMKTEYERWYGHFLGIRHKRDTERIRSVKWK
jgi:hypothetical protein